MTTDQELRKWRDAVYPPTDNPNTVQHDYVWNSIKHHWQKDEAWLREQYEKVKKKAE